MATAPMTDDIITVTCAIDVSALGKLVKETTMKNKSLRTHNAY